MKILVGVDEFKVSQTVLEVAVKHAKAFAAKLILVTSRMGGDKTSVDDVDEGNRRLEEAKRFVEHAGVPCETHLLVRDLQPGEDIVAFATEKNVDEIVIGIRKTSKMDKLVFGSTAQYVILKAPCPVVSVK